MRTSLWLRKCKTNRPLSSFRGLYENEYQFVRKKELDFLATSFVDSQALIDSFARYEGQDIGMYHHILDSACDIANDFYYDHFDTSLVSRPTLTDDKLVHHEQHILKIKRFCDAGFLALMVDSDFGGSQLPLHISALARVPFAAANVGLAGSYATMTNAVIDLLRGCESIKNPHKIIEQMVAGLAHGIVCLSEGHVDHSLTDVRCRADYDPVDRVFKVKGTKTCVYGGGLELADNLFYVVSARLPNSPEGPEGISLFLVPRRLRLHMTLEEAFHKGVAMDMDQQFNDIRIKRMFDIGSMGNQGGVLTDLEFGSESTKGAVAFLLGKENQGMSSIRRYLSVNNVQVAITAMALSHAAYQSSLRYAKDPLPLTVVRKDYVQESGVARDMDEDTRDYNDYEDDEYNPLMWGERRPLLTDRTAMRRPLIERPDVRRLLLSQKAYSEGGLALSIYALYLLDISTNQKKSRGQKDAYEELFLFLSPVVKFWCTRWGHESVSLACQVFGPLGFVKGNPVSDAMRASRMQLSEGLSNDLHAFDLLRHRVSHDSGLAYTNLQLCIKDTIQEACREGRELSEYAALLSDTLALHVDTTAVLLNSTQGRPSAELLAHSRDYADFTGHLVVGWMWLKQGIIAAKMLSIGESAGMSDQDKNFCLGKLATLEYFYKIELVKTISQAELLKRNPQIVNLQNVDWF